MPWHDNTPFTSTINTLIDDYTQRKNVAASALKKGNSTSTTIQKAVETAENALMDSIVESARSGNAKYGFGPQPDWLEEHYPWVNQKLDALNELRQQCGLAKLDRTITREGNSQQKEGNPLIHRVEEEQIRRKEKQREEQQKAWKEKRQKTASSFRNREPFSAKPEEIYERHLECGMAASWNEQWDETILNFNNALKEKPNSLNAQIRRGVALTKIPDRIQEGEEALVSIIPVG